MKKATSFLMGLLAISLLMFFVLTAWAQSWPPPPSTHGMPGPFFRPPGGPPPSQLVVEDLDGDGKKKIIVIFAGKLHVIKTDGNEIPGFPVDLRPPLPPAPGTGQTGQ